MKNRLNVDVRTSLKATGALTAEATHSKAVPAPRHSGVLTQTVLNQPESVRICCKFRLSALKLVWVCYSSVGCFQRLSLIVVIITNNKRWMDKWRDLSLRSIILNLCLSLCQRFNFTVHVL